MKRCFIAFDVPKTTASQLALTGNPPEGARFVSPDQMHITLHFLGAHSAAKVHTAIQDIRAVAFTVVMPHTGVFDSPRASVFWAKIDGGETLFTLHHELGTLLSSIGFQPEKRAYSPHLTLPRGRPNVVTVRSSKDFGLGCGPPGSVAVASTSRRPGGCSNGEHRMAVSVEGG